MKIVVIGGSGLIGSRLVARLKAMGHEAVAASPSSGVNTLTGDGLDDVLRGAQVVVDVANSPSFEDQAVYEFFDRSAKHLMPAELHAGVKHHVALSVVGADEMPGSGYMRAKLVQEAAIEASGVPYTIVRATQFFEFAGQIADGYTRDGVVRLPGVMMQPIAASDVAAALAEVAVEKPLNKMVELGGPEKIRMDDLGRRLLAAKKDPRVVETAPGMNYFGAEVTDETLVPKEGGVRGKTTFDGWLVL